jgi:hypothetical protein
VLSIDIIDRYVSVDQFDLELDLELITLTRLWIASKFEEVRPFTLVNILKFASKSIYTPRTFLEQEKKILEAIDFKLNTPTVVTY